MKTSDLATTDTGAIATDDTGDFVDVDGDPAVRARLLRAFDTNPGEIPYFDDTGAGAPSSEGGPAVQGDDLARRILTEARRDPDVLDASSAQVVRRDGYTQVSCRVRTRHTPDTPQTLALRRED
jgi:hypothetical protein